MACCIGDGTYRKEPRVDKCFVINELGGEGLERPSNSPGKQGDSNSGDAKSDARFTKTPSRLEIVTGAGRRLKAQKRRPSIASAIQRMRPMIELTKRATEGQD